MTIDSRNQRTPVIVGTGSEIQSRSVETSKFGHASGKGLFDDLLDP